MKKIIFVLCIVLFALQAVVAEDILQVSVLLEASNKSIVEKTEIGSDNLPFTFQYENVTDFDVKLNSLVLRTSDLVSEFFPSGTGIYKFYFETLDESKEIIESREFLNGFDTRGLDAVSVAFNIKYEPEIEYIRVNFGDEEKLLVDVGVELCNEDNVCSGFENYYSCPLDCAVNSEDGICIVLDDGLCDLDCVYDVDCSADDSNSGLRDSIWIILGLVLLVAIILVVIIVVVRKK